MRAILITSADHARFQSDLQHELDDIAAAGGAVEDVKFSTAGRDGGTQWSALVLVREQSETAIGLGIAEAPVSEAIPAEELIEVITSPTQGL